MFIRFVAKRIFAFQKIVCVVDFAFDLHSNIPNFNESIVLNDIWQTSFKKTEHELVT